MGLEDALGWLGKVLQGDCDVGIERRMADDCAG